MTPPPGLETPPALHPTPWRPVAAALAALGALAFAALWAVEEPRAWSGLLVGLTAVAWLGIGALCFVALHVLGGARWTVPLQGLFLGLGAGWPLAFAGFALIALLGIPALYDWSLANPGRGALFRDPAGGKAWWMQDARWAASVLACLAALWLLWRQLARHAELRDEAGRGPLLRRATLALVLAVPLATWLAWDTLLSLHVQWVSALWGLHCLAAALHAFLGAAALAAAWLGRHALAPALPPHLRHDLGTWLMAWGAVVAYLAAAQWTIIGFANIDEEAFWYLMRQQHGYAALAWTELALRCALPFAILLPRAWRASPRALAVAGAAVLVGTWLHLHWIVMPAFAPNHFRSPLGPEALIAWGCIAGAFLFAARHWRRHGLVPMADIRLAAALRQGAHA